MRLGACIGTVTPAVAQLNLKWAFGVYANAMSAEFLNLPPSVEFVPLTFENKPNASWAKIVENPNYQSEILIGSEPCGGWDNYRDPRDVANDYVAQMRALREIDPQAKFILTAGTQGQLPYNRHNRDTPLIESLWTNIPDDLRELIPAVHCHIYPRWISDDPDERWNVQNFARYIRGLRRWLRENGLGERKIWVSEFGFEGYFADDPKEYTRCVKYTRELLAHPKIRRWCARLAFYPATERSGSGGSNGYLSLLDENGALTGLGRVWTKKK